MVTSVNGKRGSSVIPIGGDEYMFLGRGRHLILDDTDVYMSGTSGNSIAEGITAAGNSRMNQIRSVANTMKPMLLIETQTPGDYVLWCNSGYPI